MVKENRKCGSHRVRQHPMTYAGAYPPYTTATYRTTIMYYSGSARKLQVLHCIFLVHRCAAAHSHIYFLCEIRVWTAERPHLHGFFVFPNRGQGGFTALCAPVGKIHTRRGTHMAKEKLKKCETCGQEIAKSCKVCPNCGAKNKKPFYKKWWLRIFVNLILTPVNFCG